jgi:hypothetical protein
VGWQGTWSCVKQWHDEFPQPGGQLHSEHRMRHPLGWQQNHSPEVWQPIGQPPPFEHVLHGKLPARVSQTGAGEKHGLHGPPPQPTQPDTAPSETSVRVSQSPTPSEPAPMNLKNCLRDERRASTCAALPATSINPPFAP